ncbi:MAG: hypothetical protein ACFFDI_00250 [Promethearchaeota archaeon]
MKGILRIIGFLILVTLVVSIFSFTTTLTTLADTPERMAQDGTWVYWDEGIWTDNSDWSWSDATWEFGPQPKFAAWQEGENKRDGEIEVSKMTEFRLTVPDAVFPPGTSFGGFELWLSSWNYDSSASLSLRYNATTDEYDLWQCMWTEQTPKVGKNQADVHKELQSINMADVETGKAEAPESFKYKSEPQDFFGFENITTKYNSGLEESYYSLFGTFASDSPEGNWWASAQVYDDSGRSIRSGWRGGECGTEFQFIIGQGEGYIMELLDDANQPTEQISPDQSVTIRLNVTEQISYAFINMQAQIGPMDEYGYREYADLWFIFDGTEFDIAGTYTNWTTYETIWINTTANQAFVKTGESIATSATNGWYVYEVTGYFTDMIISEYDNKFNGYLYTYNVTRGGGYDYDYWVSPYAQDWKYSNWEFVLAEELIVIRILDENGVSLRENRWDPPQLDTTDFFTVEMLYMGNETLFERFDTVDYIIDEWDYDPATTFEIHTLILFSYNLTSQENKTNTIREFYNYTAQDEYWLAEDMYYPVVYNTITYQYEWHIPTLNLMNQTLYYRLRADLSNPDVWGEFYNMRDNYYQTYIRWTQAINWISWDGFETYNLTATPDDLKTVFEFNFTLTNAASGGYWSRAELNNWTEYGYIDWDSSLREHLDMIIGAAKWWNYNAYEVTEEGALDLDCDLATTNDQYFVLRTWESNDSWSIEDHYAHVSVDWDPVAANIGDELHMNNWAGITTLHWTFEWAESFIWYHAADRSYVGAAELQTIKDTVWGPADLSDQWQNETDEPAEGYWDIAWLTENRSSSDPEFEDWWWTNDVEISWFYFNAEQHYFTGMSEETLQAVMTHIGLYGILLYNDSDANNILTVAANTFGELTSEELTHFVILKNASLSLVTPTYEDDSGEGTIPKTTHTRYDVDAEIHWAVKLDDINAVIFPANVYGRYYSMWDWYGGHVDNTNFDSFFSGPTEAQIERIQWTFHFQGQVGTENHVDLKVDQFIDDFENFTRGGIPLSTSMLERDLFNTTAYLEGDMVDYTGLSLAIGYDAAVFGIEAIFQDDQNNQYTEESAVQDATASDSFSITSGGLELAEFQMGGTSYIWGADGSTQTAHSQTIPVETFATLFSHQNEGSYTRISLNGTRYFMSSNFPKWGGHSIDNDPTFSAITGVGYEALNPTETTSFDPNDPNYPGAPAPGFVVVMVVLALSMFPVIRWVRKRRT